MDLDYDEDMIKLNLDQERQDYQARLEAEQEEREPGTTGPKKMGLIFFAAAGFLCVIGDAIDFFTGGTIGWFIGLFIDAILAIMFGLSSAGRKQIKRMAIGIFGESIPIIAMFPLRTGFLCWAFISSRSKIAKKVGDRVEHQIHKVAPVINAVNMAQNPQAARNNNKPTGGLHVGNKVSDELRQQAVIGSGPTDRIIDVSRGAQEARNMERSRNKNREIIDVSPGAQERRNLEASARRNGSKESGAKINSMSIHDELWELNAKPDLDSHDKERLLKAHWIMEHNHIEDKEKDDPVLLRAWERVNRGEVIFDGSPEKRHGFSFSNVQIINATNTIAGRDFASLNPQYGGEKKN